MKGWKVLACVVVLLLVAAFSPGIASTPTGATYDVWARGMIAKQAAEYPHLAALDAGYVQANYNGNKWWLDTLLGRINAKFPWYATKLTTDELTRFALVKVQIIARTAQEDCEKTLIRDALSHLRFPTDAEFKACDYPHNQAWWAVQYPDNVQAVINAFDGGQAFVWIDGGRWKSDVGDYPN